MIWDVIRAPFTIFYFFFNVWWGYEDNYKKYLENKSKHQEEMRHLEDSKEVILHVRKNSLSNRKRFQGELSAGSNSKTAVSDRPVLARSPNDLK